MLNGAPLPVSATFNAARTEVKVQFDKPLAPSGSSQAFWQITLSNLDKIITPPVLAAGFEITLVTSAGPVLVETDVVNYDGLDGSMRGIDDIPIAAFSIQPFLEVP